MGLDDDEGWGWGYYYQEMKKEERKKKAKAEREQRKWEEAIRRISVPKEIEEELDTMSEDEGWIWHQHQQEEEEEEQQFNEIPRDYISSYNIPHSYTANRTKTAPKELLPPTRVEDHPRLLKSLMVVGAILGIIVGLYIGGLFFIVFFGIFGMLGLPFIAHLTFSRHLLHETCWLVGTILGFMQGLLVGSAFSGAFILFPHINWAGVFVGVLIGGVPGALFGLVIGAQS